MKKEVKIVTLWRYALCPILCALCFFVPVYAESGGLGPAGNAKPWHHGLQFGAGVPVTLTGYNGFVGYANKKSDNWFGRRLGARLDFQIPSTLNANATLSANGNEYDVDVDAKLLFYKRNFDNAASIDGDFDIDIDGTPYDINLDGANGSIALKNQNIGAMIDFYPFGDTWFLGGIRLSGGYYTGRMDLSIHATLGDNDLLNPEYVYDGIGNGDKILANIRGKSRVGADLKWKYSGPYAGFGFDLGIFRGFKFYLDAGMVFAKPPKVSRSNITAPTLYACYQVSGGTCAPEDRIHFDLNSKPDVTMLTKDVLTQVIKQNVENNADFATIQNALETEYGVSIDYGAVGNAIFDFLECSGSTADCFAAGPSWMNDIYGSGIADVQEIRDSLDKVRTEWDNITDATNTDSFQSQVDDAWADYEQGIADLNDSLKDMKFMPVVKVGVMYRF